MGTLICVPITVRDEASALNLAQIARDLSADLVEFRIDEWFSGTGDPGEISGVVRLASESPLPCIITCRPTAEGGYYDGDEDARIALFERLGTAFGTDEHPPRYIDVELSTYARSANIRQKVNLAVEHPEQIRDLSTSLILSLHDLNARPRDLSRQLLAMQSHAAAKVLKIAYRARSIRDNIDLFEMLAHRDRPMIALGMGEFGQMSRILAPKFGGFLTFASIRPAEVTAPGQPTIGELLDTFRFRSIRPSTQVYGIVGYPLAQSLSPRIHNAGFDVVGHDGVYVPLPVTDSYESLKASLLELLHHEPLHLRGVSVTHPHKGNLLRLAREEGWTIDDTADTIGAANTLIRDEGGIRILNTDAPAITAAMLPAIGEVADRRIAIVGAGGAARAAAVALAGHGAHVTIHNRSFERGRSLAAELSQRLGRRIAASPLDAVADESPEAVVHCTPVGMHSGPDEQGIAVDIAALAKKNPRLMILETVYNPVQTPLLRAARSAGLRVTDGVPMFVHQAALQFQAWTGKPAPIALFERLVREAAGHETGPAD